MLTLAYIIIHILLEKGTCPKFLIFIFCLIISSNKKTAILLNKNDLNPVVQLTQQWRAMERKPNNPELAQSGRMDFSSGL